MPGMNLVKASNLEAWSRSLTARANLPGVVASLIRSSCPTLQSYRFPSGDASQTHGFDGVAEVVTETTFVPSGRSIWEFGTGENYEKKASDDFKKRTDELSADDRATRTFTFVTSRIWDGGPEDWEKERASAGWLKVRALDATSIELWLLECPAVSLALAKDLSIIPPTGVRTIPEFWDEYRLNFDPVLKEDLLLAGREEKAKRLCQSLSEGLKGISKWQGDSAAEAIAFMAASIMKADPETSAFLISKTLVIETPEIAQILPATNRFNFILTPTAARVGPALARTSQVTFALGSDDRAGEAELLDRMNTRDFAAGLKSMGLDDEESFRLATRCGRSVTVLSRLNASSIARPPEWHRDSTLVPFVLAGGWDAQNEYDRAAMEKLCNTRYENIDASARKFASIADPPIDLDGAVWTLRSPTDAFTLLGSLIDTATQQRLRNVCIDVLGEKDLTLEVPEDKRPIIPTRGADFHHSEWIRRGLARSLLLVSGLHEAAKFKVIGATPEQFVDDIMGSLPGLAQDIRLIASLKSELPMLAEAAPLPLASALERVLGGDGAVWTPIIFRDRKDQSFLSSFSPHTYILWALETMAWSPKHLHRAASILMKLADHDPGGSTTNRPLHSLREIFLAWRPNTYASLEERTAVCRSICLASKKTGLELAMALLPTPFDHSSSTAKPRLRGFGDAQSKPVTYGDANTAFQRYGDLAVELAGTDISALSALVERLPHLSPTTRDRALAAMKSAVEGASSEEEVFKLWTGLRDLVQKHRSFQEANWAMSEDQLGPIEKVCKEIEPRDPVRQVLWLFNDYAPQGGMPKGQDYIEEANRDRADAVRELLNRHGVAAVLELAKTAKLPHFVGIAMAQATDSIELLKQIFEASLHPESSVNIDFAIALSAMGHQSHGAEWDDWMVRLASTLRPDSAANLFLRWPDNHQTWNIVTTVSPEAEREYWKRKWAFKPSSQDELLCAFGKYSEIGRFSAILDMIGYDEAALSTSRCIATLRGLIGELNADPPKLQRIHYQLVHMIQALQQREDRDLAQIAALEYEYLPLLEFETEPVALNQILAGSPDFFIKIICDAFAPSSGPKEPITDDRKLRARLGYQVLQSMKMVPGFSSGIGDLDHLRAWISEVRALAKVADREVITDQQIGQVLAYAPADTDDGAWPTKKIRDLIEELAAEQIEVGIMISRFNQRGSFRKELFDGGNQERGIAKQYRDWAAAARNWPRTKALLERIAEDWHRQAKRADTEARLDQVRDG
jgi:hypothetical protein